jgi:hypothetical protein
MNEQFDEFLILENNERCKAPPPCPYKIETCLFSLKTVFIINTKFDSCKKMPPPS